MEQAAAYTMNEQQHPAVSARLRLRQGSSTRATWILEEAPGGTMITIGTDPTCDWQIRAAFVPARAFSVLLVSGALYVRPGVDLGVSLNGRPLAAQTWTKVDAESRVDCGLAQLEIAPEYAQETFTLHETSAYVAPNYAQEPTFVADAEGHAYRKANDDPPEPRARNAHYDRTRELDSGTYPIFEESDRERVPAVLEHEERTRSDRRGLFRYALAGVATACAYGGWIVLLDFL
jgi:predicted component of type VI protein secretion system